MRKTENKWAESEVFLCTFISPALSSKKTSQCKTMMGAFPRIALQILTLSVGDRFYCCTFLTTCRHAASAVVGGPGYSLGIVAHRPE